MQHCQWSNYDVENKTICNTEILKSNLCDHNYGYIFVRGVITVIAAPAAQVSFKNCASFSKCITKIVETPIDGTEDLDLVMPVYIW